LISPAPW